MKTIYEIFGVEKKQVGECEPVKRIEDMDCSSRLEAYFKENNSPNQPHEDQVGQGCIAFIEKYKEQRKVIEEIKAMAENWINQEYTYNSDSTDIKIQQMKDCGRDIIRKINGE